MASLLLDTELSDEQRDFAQTINLSAENLLTLVNDILDLSKIEAGKLTIDLVAMNLREVVEEVATLLGVRAAEKGLSFAARVAPGIPERVLGDPGRFRQVLTNLAGNAVKFTERGQVLLDLAPVQRDGNRLTVHLRIVDSGIGIPAEKLGQIFDKFTQADASTTRRYGGTGLGLAICRELVELMGGQIGVESTTGAGSTFWCTLPFEVVLPERAAPPRLDGQHILLSAADPTERGLVAELLTAEGASVIAAASVGEALRHLQEAIAGRRMVHSLVVDAADVGSLLPFLNRTPALRSTRLVLLAAADHRTDPRLDGLGPRATSVFRPYRQRDLLEAVGPGGHRPIHPAESAEPEGPVLGPARILLVEDGLVNQKVALNMLRRFGCRTDVAGDGVEALERLAEAAYDLVLLDCQMPRMDGFTTVRALRERESAVGQHLPVIAMTAHAMQGDRERCLAAGMDDYLTKPVDREALAGILARWIPGRYLLTRRVSEPVVLPATEPSLDYDVVAGLQELEASGESGLFAEVVSLFAGQGQLMMEKLHAAVAAGDEAGWRQALHGFVGTAGSVGALRLSERCRELEEGVGGLPADAAATLAELEEAFAEARAELGRVGELRA